MTNVFILGSLLLLLYLLQLVYIHPFRRHKAALLLFAQVNCYPKRNVQRHTSSEWSNAAGYQVDGIEREIGNDADDTVLADELQLFGIHDES